MEMISRRSFLKGTGVVAAAATLAACGGTASTTTSTATSTASSAASGASSDVLSQFDDAAAGIADWAGKYDSLIQEVYTATDLDKREATMHAAEDLLMSTWCIIPIYFYVHLYIQKPAVTDIISTVTGMMYYRNAHNSANSDASLNLCLASEPDYMDPVKTSSVDGGTMMCNLFAGLLTYGKDGKLTNDCADSYEASADGETYTFTLKDGLKWSDGTAMDAKDFLYSWNRAVDETTASDYSYLFDVIARKDDGSLDVTASDDGKTLTVKLNGLIPYFLSLCAFPTFFPVPQKVVEDAMAKAGSSAVPNQWALEAPFVSNGPYTLTAWEHNASLTMEANPNYWDAANVTIPKLNFMLSDDTTAIYSAYQTGDLDLSAEVPTEEIPNLKSAGTDLHIDPYLGTYYFCANVKSDLFTALEPQQACALRKALCLIIDRDYIIENIAQGGQVPANCFVSNGCSDGHGGIFRENNDGYEYPSKDALGYFDPEADNTEEIKTLLGAAGYKVGDDGMLDSSTPFSFTYLVNSTSGNTKIAEALQQDYAGYGIDMQVSQEEWKVFLEDRKNGNYDIARNGWIMDYDDPVNELEMWTTESGNNDIQFGK